MGNTLLRENRCWNRHIAEGCFCLPWKKIPIFKARQDSQKKNEGTSSATTQDNADQTFMEELCYTLINHGTLSRMPSGISAEACYENVPPKAQRPRELVRGTETEYSLLRVQSTPQHPPSPENEYELVTPHRNSSHPATNTSISAPF
ncbi:germinal center-associated signaling and motility protein isoform X4 [Rhinolophus ferrumequinum]|uniref:germinal center-associated signaling and motility protein isoform X4 n=1 Tax=Rhinolophus ferrumequinum TaxID=59479 RepID=UPI00140FDEA6|nr:germinal center-associated signaling and motility protein isoform X4 [Rhinolophus ferrumequinum]